jgi:aryl-alcohol dehydrogenase-like predicted oxidoreductase
LLDTAPAYGVSEERLGYLLRKERREWVICTKAGEEFSRDYDSDGVSNFNFEADAIRLSVERSLRRLRTDYLDIVLIHSDGNDSHLIHHHQVLHTLSTLKKEGWIRAFGMSTKTQDGGIICAREADVVMTTFNQEQEEDVQLMQCCTEHQTGVLLKKIFNSGHLLKPEYTNKTINAIIEQQMTGIFAQNAVNSAIIGTLNSQHLRNNVECALMGLAENCKLA